MTELDLQFAPDTLDDMRSVMEGLCPGRVAMASAEYKGKVWPEIRIDLPKKGDTAFIWELISPCADIAERLNLRRELCFGVSYHRAIKQCAATTHIPRSTSAVVNYLRRNKLLP